MDPKAFFQLSYGVYLLSTAYENKDYGCIINTACQVTASPAQISVAVNKQNYTCEMIQKSGHFAVHVLTQDAHMEFIGRYGFTTGKEINKFAGMDVTRAANGMPLLLDSTEVGAAFSCKVVASLDVGTHILFIGLVEDAIVTGYGKPLTYADYHLVKKGVTPPKASSFQPEAPKNESGKPQWRCTVCGHIHTGDQPPEKCPICGQGPEKFEKL